MLTGLASASLQPAAPASPQQLIRRVSLDLTGLPPTPADIDAFVKDRSPDALERLIDRLLASSHYGERWARHWLDLVRYAESDGFEHDALRPHSWRYRDYVIRAFNDDKPYDRFIEEQLAGDELWPDEPDAIIATAFNLLGPDMVDSADQIQRRLNTLNDAVDTTASVFLGLTLGCARCHNHKFEPFTQQDYYSLQAFYASARFERELPVPSPAQRAAHDAAMISYREKAGSTQSQLDALEAPHRVRVHEQKLASLSEDARLAHRTPKEKRTMEQEGTVQETAPSLKISEGELADALAPAERSRRKELIDILKKISKPAALPTTMALQTVPGKHAKTFVLTRGDYNNPAEEAPPGFPAILSGASNRVAPASVMPQRATLARWIASADNPLTARVMVNRIWQHHFGRGLVTTPSDFGVRGARPANAALLDWLAVQFAKQGWSVKAMHKLMLMSATYQQSTTPRPESLVRDPENILFSRQNRVRLEGEAIRDSLLAISGRLNPSMGGPPVAPSFASDSTGGSKTGSQILKGADPTRRSIYILARRNLRFPFLEVFDAPDNNLTCPERGHGTTAPQSLTLLNSDEVMDAARATAQRLLTESLSVEARIHRAFRLIIGRGPTSQEMSITQDFLKSSDDSLAEAPPRATGGAKKKTLSSTDSAAAWTELCRALFNLNAFVYVE
ncbi:MAG: hypothetical protein QOF48_1993 [Verrucomicrobiota bacterium]